MDSHGWHAVTGILNSPCMARTQCLGLRELVESDSLPAVCLGVPSAAVGMQRGHSWCQTMGHGLLPSIIAAAANLGHASTPERLRCRPL